MTNMLVADSIVIYNSLRISCTSFIRQVNDLLMICWIDNNRWASTRCSCWSNLHIGERGCGHLHIKWNHQRHSIRPLETGRQSRWYWPLNRPGANLLARSGWHSRYPAIRNSHCDAADTGPTRHGDSRLHHGSGWKWNAVCLRHLPTASARWMAAKRSSIGTTFQPFTPRWTRSNAGFQSFRCSF